MQEEKPKKGKVAVWGYVSPNIKRMIKETIEAGDYGSESDFVSEAVIKLAYEWQRKRERRVGKLELE
jgi:Arc/MetJ-type ribon-helix-helix transcriptional regulator